MFQRFSSINDMASSKGSTSNLDYKEEDYVDAQFEIDLMIEDSKTITNETLVNYFLYRHKTIKMFLIS